MAREFARRFYKSKGWERARKLAMERTITYPSGAVCPSGMCQRCFETTGRLVPAEIVHHKVYLTPENITEAIRRLAKVIEERLELYRAFIDAGAIKVPEE